jgi:hypothetical protein
MHSATLVAPRVLVEAPPAAGERQQQQWNITKKSSLFQRIHLKGMVQQDVAQLSAPLDKQKLLVHGDNHLPVA